MQKKEKVDNRQIQEWPILSQVKASSFPSHLSNSPNLYALFSPIKHIHTPRRQSLLGS